MDPDPGGRNKNGSETLLKILPFEDKQIDFPHHPRHGTAEFGKPTVYVGLSHSQISEEEKLNIIKKYKY